MVAQTRIDFRDQIASNKMKSFLLIVVIFLFFLALGYIISLFYDASVFFVIMIISIVISLIYIWVSYYFSDKIAVASVGAKPASRQEHSQFYRSIESLTIASGLPMPKLYVMQSEQVNAFATGRNPKTAVVCVTTGALNKLDKYELEGVLAHEMSHVANYDVRFMTLVAVMVGMVAIVSEIFLRSLWFKNSDDNKGNAILLIVGIILAIAAPILTQIVQLAISRKREYVADANAVKFTRYPKGLIGALEKIKNENDKPDKKVPKAVASLMFASPQELFSTHPSINKRIEILKRM
ncbi:MAG: M48 family metallopeptidase [Candidatus Pacearchaeota archaeon]